MPRVRIPTPQVSTEPLPSPRAARADTTPGFAALARGLDQVAESGEAIADRKYREQKKAGEDAWAMRLQELEADYTGTVNDGLTNSEHGLLNQQGQNASAASVPFYDALDKRRKELLDQVDDERAKRILDVRLRALQMSAHARGETHVAAEIQRADDTSFSILKDRVKDRVAESAVDPAERAASIEQLVPQLRSYAARKGLKPDDATGLEAQWRGEAAEVALDRLIASGQITEAQNYLSDPSVRQFLGDRVSRIEHALRAATGKASAAGLALRILQVSRDEQNPSLVDPAKAYTALDAAFAPDGPLAASPDLYFEAQSMLAKSITDHNAVAKAGFDRVAGVAIGQYLSIDAGMRPHASFSNVSPLVRAELEASGKDGQELLRQMLEWDRSAEAQRRTARNMPTDEEAGRAFAIERSIAVNPGAWRALSGADQMAVLTGKRPVPGEPDAPAVAVSARDVPGLASRIAGVSAAVAPSYITDPSKVAFEVAEEVYPHLRKYASNQTGIPSGEARTAVRLLSDKLSEYINGEKNRTGKEPSQAEIRREAQRLMQTVEVQRSFLGVSRTGKTPRILAEQKGEPFTVTRDELSGQPQAPPAPAPVNSAAPPPPAGTPPGWIPYRNERTGEVRYNAPGKATGDWKELR